MRIEVPRPLREADNPVCSTVPRNFARRIACVTVQELMRIGIST